MTWTCVQLPPVDLAEEGVRPELVAGAVLEAESPVHLFHEQALTQRPALLAELFRIHDRIIQDPLLQHLILHLKTGQRSAEMVLYLRV